MLISKNGYQIRNPHGQNPPGTGFADFQNLPIFTEKFAGRVNWNSASLAAIGVQLPKNELRTSPKVNAL